MPRFPIKQNQIECGVAIISGSDYRHVVKVLRLKAGHGITLFDESGMEHYGAIAEIGKREIRIAIAESKKVETESVLSITLLQGIPKGDKMDLIVEKATELGVKNVVPVVTERSQVRETKKVQRWQRIALESSKQCGRLKPPEIHEAVDFRGALEFSKDSKLHIIFYEKSPDKINKIFNSTSERPTDITLFIGPEGGFSEEEVKLATEKGFTPVGLGPRILRTETAGIVAITVLQFICGDLG